MRLTEEDIIKEEKEKEKLTDNKDDINIEETGEEDKEKTPEKVEDDVEQGKGYLKKSVKKKKNTYVEEMSTKEKIAYFWDYNKATLGVIIGISIVLILFIRAIIIELKPPLLYISMSNAHMETSADATFGYDYGNDRELNTKKGKITMDVEYVYPEEITDLTLAQEQITASIQKYASAITNSYIDASIATDWVIKEFQMADCYTDMRELYTEEQMQAFGEDRWYWAVDEAGTKIVAGIIINGLRGIDDFYDEGETVMIAIPYSSKRKDIAKDFILWFFE